MRLRNALHPNDSLPPDNIRPLNGPFPPNLASAPRPKFAASAPFDLCFTPAAMEELLTSVGSHAPETGAKGFGPTDQFGFDVVEFDIRGSQQAGNAVYSPDVLWGMQRCQHWLNQPGDEMRLWSGDIHSHPGLMGHPSEKSGRGLGDLGYVEEVFAQNEAMQFFAMPIVTLSAPGCPALIWPWIVTRDDPHRPLWANLRVCPASEFPDRQFNPAWEDSLEGNNLNIIDPDNTVDPDSGGETYNGLGGSPIRLDGPLRKPDLLSHASKARQLNVGTTQDALMLGAVGICMLGLAFAHFFARPREPGTSPLLSGIVRQTHIHSILSAELDPEIDVEDALTLVGSKLATLLNPTAPLSRTTTSFEETIMNAYDIIARLNPNALPAEENGRDLFIEDFPVDNRWYRFEYRCLPSGSKASAWLLHNPWGGNQYSYEQSHLRSDGMICIGPHFDPDDSPFNLEFAIRRARFWAFGFAFLLEHGYAATCEAIPEWGSYR